MKPSQTRQKRRLPAAPVVVLLLPCPRTERAKKPQITYPMFDDISAYFYEHVVAVYVHYRNTRDEPKAGLSKDLQAATAAANALFHFREHLVAPHAMSRAEVAALCPDYDLIGDIANASKHAQLTRGTPKITSAQSLCEVVVLTEYSDDQGTFTDARKLVIAELDDGTEREVFEIATNVINFWGDQLVRWGMHERYKPFPRPDAPGSSALSRGEVRGLDFEMIQGVRFKMLQRLQRFNASKGCSEPIDLTGSTITFNLHKPTVPLDVVFTHNQTGEQRHFSMDITREQADALEALPSEEKESFIRKLFEQNSNKRSA